jgi:hypothetical protein
MGDESLIRDDSKMLRCVLRSSVMLYLGLVAFYGAGFAIMFFLPKPDDILGYCGHFVTESFTIVLGYGFPISTGALVGLEWIRRREKRNARSLMIGTALYATATATALLFGIWYCKMASGGDFRMADFVWWIVGF